MSSYINIIFRQAFQDGKPIMELDTYVIAYQSHEDAIDFLNSLVKSQQEYSEYRIIPPKSVLELETLMLIWPSGYHVNYTIRRELVY